MASQMWKIKKIKEAIKDNNIEELCILAKKHGFINNKLRKKAWPLLLNIKMRDKQKQRTRSRVKSRRKRSLSLISTDSNTSPCSNKDNYHQIEKDINRSAINFYNTKETKSQSRDDLGRILHSMFDDVDDMHYYQGFNDVVSVFYTVCGQHDLAKKLSKKVAKTKLSQYIVDVSDELNFNSLKLMSKIIKYDDIELTELFNSFEDGHLLSVCVSWLITWFAHEIKNISIIARIYDYCLCSHESISIYLSAALLLSLKQDLLLNVNDDMSLHLFFSNFKWQQIDFNKVISKSEQLFTKYPPSIISPASYSISEMSQFADNDEIKENAINDISESSSDWNSDYTPSTDCNEEMANFDIDDDQSHDQKEEIKEIKENTQRFGAKLPKLDFFDSLQTIPDSITNTIDDFISIFDKKHKKYNNKKKLSISIPSTPST